jgi:hypothetical protein
VLGFSSAGVCPSVAYYSWRVAQPPGILPDGGVLAASGLEPFITNNNQQWGQYFATAPAGMVSGGGTGGFPKMWFSGLFGDNVAAQGYRTVIGRTGYNAINQNIPSQTSSR